MAARARRHDHAESPRPRRPAPRACRAWRGAQEARHRGRLAACPARRRRPTPANGATPRAGPGRDALPQLRPPRDGLRRVRRRSAARPFQSGLSSISGSSMPNGLPAHPRDGEILDRLRASRASLPEKADYRDWKQSWLSAYGSNSQRRGSMASARRAHAARRRRQRGGRRRHLPLRERHRAARAREPLQRARSTCSARRSTRCAKALRCSAPNGRLRLHNRAFASIWRLSPALLGSRAAYRRHHLRLPPAL